MKKGKFPQGDRSIKGDLSIEIAYADDSSSASVLEKVEQVLRDEAPSRYAGCPSVERRFLSEAGALGEPEEEDVSVTGVNFNNWKILDKGKRDHT